MGAELKFHVSSLQTKVAPCWLRKINFLMNYELLLVIIGGCLRTLVALSHSLGHSDEIVRKLFWLAISSLFQRQHDDVLASI